MDFGAGNTGFMLVATALVMIMTPGLAFFYGGLVGSKNVVAVMMHSFVSLGVSTILWYAVGFSLSFSGGEGGVIGNLDWGLPEWGFAHGCMVRGGQHSDSSLFCVPDDVCGHHSRAHHGARSPTGYGSARISFFSPSGSSWCITPLPT